MRMCNFMQKKILWRKNQLWIETPEHYCYYDLCLVNVNCILAWLICLWKKKNICVWMFSLLNRKSQAGNFEPILIPSVLSVSITFKFSVRMIYQRNKFEIYYNFFFIFLIKDQRPYFMKLLSINDDIEILK